MTQRFEAFAASHPTGLPAFPVRVNVLLDFVCDYVNSNNGSAKSVDRVVYVIKKHCIIHRIQWLDSADESLLKRSIKHLAFVDQIPSKQKSPLGYEILSSMTRRMNPSKRHDARLLALYWIAYEGALRSDELLGGRCLGDIVWSNNFKQFTLILLRTKTHRKGPPLRILYTSATDGSSSAVLYLKNYLTVYSLWNKSKQCQLFPSPHNNVKSMSAAWFRIQVKKSISVIGLEPSQYSSHSFRAGLATDMFKNDVPLQTVQWAGRWRSICALVYYRDNADKQNKVIAALAHVRQAHKLYPLGSRK